MYSTCSCVGVRVCIFQVLFPLLECVQHTLDTAEQLRDKVQADSIVIVHHSRNTKRKQWAETQVLTLQGISGVFSQNLEVLAVLTGFHRAWDLLLSAIHTCVSEGQGELATAALRSLHQLLLTRLSSQTEQHDLWQQLWQVWRQLALQCSQLPTTQTIGFRQATAAASGTPSSEQPVDRCNLQSLLCLHMQQFSLLRQHLLHAFKSAHIQQLKNVLEAVLGVPADQVTLMTSNSGMTPLQDAALEAVGLICKELEDAGKPADVSSSDSMLFALFEVLLQMTSFSTSLPASILPATKDQRQSCVSLGEAAWKLVLRLFNATGGCGNSTIVLSVLKVCLVLKMSHSTFITCLTFQPCSFLSP